MALAKPIIVIKPGHIGSLTGSDEVLDAAFRRYGVFGSDEVLDAAFRGCGVLRVEQISDLFGMADMLSICSRG